MSKKAVVFRTATPASGNKKQCITVIIKVWRVPGWVTIKDSGHLRFAFRPKPRLGEEYR